MTFSLHQRGVVMSGHITPMQWPTTHSIAHIPGTCALIFSCFAIFTVYPNRIMWRHPTHLNVIIYKRAGGRSERTHGQAIMATLNAIIYICTRAFHSFHCRAASTIISLLPKATFTASIQPNLCLPRTGPSLTFAIYRIFNGTQKLIT